MNRTSVVCNRVCVPLLVLLAAAPVTADLVNLEWRPGVVEANQNETVSIGLYAVTDTPEPHQIFGAQVIVFWDPDVLEFLGVDDTGGPGWMFSGFMDDSQGDGLNTRLDDGDAYYWALSGPGSSPWATPEGLLVTTFQFKAVAPSPESLVEIVEEYGQFSVTGVISARSGLNVVGTVDDAVITVTGSAPVPEIVHGAPGFSFAEHAFGGYVDPRCDSGTPPFCYANQINRLHIVFNTEPFGDAQGGPVTADNFTVTETGGAAPPNVVDAIRSGEAVTVVFDRAITYGEWTTVQATVFNGLGDQIPNSGNQGPGVDELDRIDVAALGGDIDQGGRTLPLDNTRFLQMYGDSFHNPRGVDEDYLDINRDGNVLPFDLMGWRLNYNAWLFGQLPSRP